MARPWALIAVLAIALAGSTGAFAAPSPPGEEAMALGRRLAETGDFRALLKTVAEAQIGELQRGTPGLTPSDKETVARIGRRTLDGALAKIVDELGAIYAQAFSVADLKAMVAFFSSPAGKAYAQRYAVTLPALAKTLGGFDFKRDTLAAVCKEIQKGCPAR